MTLVVGGAGACLQITEIQDFKDNNGNAIVPTAQNTGRNVNVGGDSGGGSEKLCAGESLSSSTFLLQHILELRAKLNSILGVRSFNEKLAISSRRAIKLNCICMLGMHLTVAS